MACLSVNITPIRPAETVVAAVAAASANANVATQAKTSVEVSPVAKVGCQVQSSAVAVIALTGRMVVNISEVCAIGGGDLYVLAASDGILRTREGGFFLLDPAREDSEA
jgi:hypothetical protein